MKFLDYRDLKDKYDAIASIEMIEAVGEKHLNKYFSTIKNNLKPIISADTAGSSKYIA